MSDSKCEIPYKTYYVAIFEKNINLNNIKESQLDFYATPESNSWIRFYHSKEDLFQNEKAPFCYEINIPETFINPAESRNHQYYIAANFPITRNLIHKIYNKKLESADLTENSTNNYQP